MRRMMTIFVLICLNSAVAPADFDYTLVWRYPAGASAVARLAPRDSLVYVGSGAGSLTAIRWRDGVTLWEHSGAGSVRHPPLLSGRMVMWADDRGKVRVADRFTGLARWEAALAGSVSAMLEAAEPVLLVSGQDGRLYGLDTASGHELWRARVDQQRIAPMTRAPDGQVIAGGASCLMRIQAASGRRQLRHPTGDYRIIDMDTRDDVVLAACDDGYLRGYDPRDLSMRWERRLGSRPEVMLVAAAGPVVTVTRSGWLYGVEAATGRMAWYRDMEAAPVGMVAAGQEPFVIIGTEAGRLAAVAVDDGRVDWDLTMPGRRPVRPLAATESLLLTWSGDGGLHAFERITRHLDEPAEDDEEWWAQYGSGRRTGYRHRVTRKVEHDGRPARLRIDTSVDWGRTVVRRQTSVWVDEDLRPLGYHQGRLDGMQLIEARGRWQGDTLTVQRSLGETAYHDTVLTGTEFLMPEWFPARTGGGPITGPGLDSTRVFDYDTLQPVWQVYETTAASDTSGGASLKMRQVGQDRAGTPIELVRWLDPQGRMVRRRTPLLATAATRVTAAEALVWRPSERVPSPVLDHGIERAAAADAIELKLPDTGMVAEAVVIPASRQMVHEGPDGGVTIRTLPLSLERPDEYAAAEEAAVLAGFLQPSLYVQSDHPGIQQQAAALRRGTADELEFALRVHQWVYDNMLPRVMPTGFRSAVEVIADMQGTCSEYTVLVMALARAAGLPARACSGLLIQDSGDLVPHLWAQVWVDNRWIDLDATLPQPGLTAAHVHTGTGLLTPAGMRTMNLPLQLFLARVDTVAVLSYRHGERRFMARAAALYQDAVEARRSGDQDKALKLYHQLTEKEWNLHSGRAYAAIAHHHLRREEFDRVRWACEQILLHEPDGPEADDALFYLARAAEKAGDPEGALEQLERLVRELPDHALADEALARRARLLERTHGCSAAVPEYERLRREYPHSGWASVARTALERCARD